MALKSFKCFFNCIFDVKNLNSISVSDLMFKLKLRLKFRLKFKFKFIFKFSISWKYNFKLRFKLNFKLNCKFHFKLRFTFKFKLTKTEYSNLNSYSNLKSSFQIRLMGYDTSDSYCT